MGYWWSIWFILLGNIKYLQGDAKNSTGTLHNTVCELISKLSWRNILILSDSETESIRTWTKCSPILDISYQQHTLCSDRSAVITWDVCTPQWTHHVILDVSESCLLNVISQVLLLEEHCQGSLSFKTKWIAVLQKEETYNKLTIMDNSLYNLLIVYECNIRNVITKTLVRLGDAHTMADVNWKISKELYPNKYCGLCGKTIKVSTMPYASCTRVTKWPNGTALYNGLTMVMLDALSESLNFSYTISTPSDNEWGVNRDGQWTGLVGQLHRKEIDLAAACLSVSEGRTTVIDFTKDVLSEKAIVLLPLADPTKTKWQIYAQPFRLQMWIIICFGILFGALLLQSMSRMSDYINKPCLNGRTRISKIMLCIKRIFGRDQDGEDTDRVNQSRNEDNYDRFSAALWFTFGAALTQGSNINPRTGTLRLFVSFWWLGCVILGAAYTGKLVSFLAMEKQGPIFNTVEELANQEELQLGLLGGTLLEDFFLINDNSPNQMYKKIRQKILLANQSDQSVLEKSIDSHIQKVINGGYAMIEASGGVMDALIKYPNLTTIDFGFGSGLTHYAFALQQNSVYKELIDARIDGLWEAGLMVQWQKKQWSKTIDTSSTLVVTARQIRLLDCQGAFYVLAVLMVLASVVLAAECLVKSIMTRSSDCLR